jgi:hypothetical protein
MTAVPQIADLHPDRVSIVGGAVDPQDWRDWKVREWLLLLLRFAITTDIRDQMAALAMAEEIDASGMRWRPSGPSFFSRSSQAVCAAILDMDNPGRRAVLKAHIRRIEDARLRLAFAAATGVDDDASDPVEGRTGRRPDLWRGLRGS